MTGPSNYAGVFIFLVVSLAFLSASPSHAQSSWGRCEKNADWTDRIAACQSVIRSGDNAKRLAVAHYYVATNLDLSYQQHLRGNDNEIDKALGVTSDLMCDPVFMIYGPTLEQAQRGCMEFRAFLGVDQPRVGEPKTTDIKRVLEEYNKALGFDPGHIDARRSRGVIFRRQDRYQDAIADYDVVLRDNPNDTFAHFSRGEAYYKSGNYAAAIPDFNAALNVSTITAKQKRGILSPRAYAYFATKNYDAAILDYSAIIKSDGANLKAYGDRGRAYLATGKFEEAVADIGRALAMKPPKEEKALLHSVRARALFDLGKFTQATDDLTKALTLGLHGAAERAQAYELRAFSAMRQQDYGGAIDDFSSVIELNQAPHLYFHRANLLRTVGKGDAAVSDYQTVIADERSPVSLKSQSYLGLAIISHGRRDVVNAMASYDAFFASLASTDDQTRALGARIVQSLIKLGLYSGTAQKYDAELRDALAACIASPACNP